MRFALKVGCLAFDSTRISAANVDFPIDVVAYDCTRRVFLQHRYMKERRQRLDPERLPTQGATAPPRGSPSRV